MADLYSDFCTHLAKAELSLANPEAVVLPVEIDVRKLEDPELNRDQFFLDIKSQVAEFMSGLKQHSGDRNREVFFATLYTGLLATTQATEPLLRKKMLVKLYSWLIANKTKGSCFRERSSSGDRGGFIVFPMKARSKTQKHEASIQVRHLDQNKPIEANHNYDHPSHTKPPLVLRDEFKVFVKPRIKKQEEISPSITKKLLEYRRAQMKTLRDLVESKRMMRTWSRGKSRAQEMALYRAEVIDAGMSPDQWEGEKFEGRRPPTVVDCTTGSSVTPALSIRPKSKLERARYKAERFFKVDNRSKTPARTEMNESWSFNKQNAIQELSIIKFRLSQTHIPVSYKTLAGGLVPPRPALDTDELPQGGERLTSNPYLRFPTSAVKKTRNTSLIL